MKKIFLISALTIFLAGCSLQDVNIEKQENNIQTIQTTDLHVQNDDNTSGELVTQPTTDETERKLRPELGEKFFPYTIVEGGGNLTVDSAEIYHNLRDSGINEDETRAYRLLKDDGEPVDRFNRITEEEGPVYNKATGDILNGFSIVKVHFTFENENAVSLVNDMYTILPEEKYNDDVFSVGPLQLCAADDSNMNTKMNYFCYDRFYFSLENTVDYTMTGHNGFFKCPVGEKVEFDLAYLVDCAPEDLCLAITSGNKCDTMVDLKLGGD